MPAVSPSQPQLSRRAQRHHAQRVRARWRVIGPIALVVVVGTVVAVVVLAGGDADKPVASDGSTIEVSLGDYSIVGDLTAPAGTVRLQAVNDGRIDHNVGVRGGPISGNVRPGDEITLELGDLAPGTYELYCDLVGHVEQGMVAELVITQPVPDATPTTAPG